MVWQFLSWYLIVQLITLAALPLTLTLFYNLPDRGYAFAKSLGILLVGVLFWLGFSYGLLRNETGGAWLALAMLAVLSLLVSRQHLLAIFRRQQGWLRWRHVLQVEVIFLALFAAWAYIRAYDPAVDHTEEPMDLMFMNSIWTSPAYPPHDAWFSGYPISYYYFGYWLLTTLGRLAGQPPEIAYTLGQACWYGLLWIGCFGVVYNLLAQQHGHGRRAGIGGLLAGLSVAFVGNLQGFFEWLYANYVDVTPLARWFAVHDFPVNAQQTGYWYIGLGNWWWWRASRVVSDRWLNGDHWEVIDEFPLFSYMLGDNHPHVIAMPMVLLVIALAQNLFFGEVPLLGLIDGDSSWSEWIRRFFRMPGSSLYALKLPVPLGYVGMAVAVVASGSLIFLNTWDYPAYWLLLVVAYFAVVWRSMIVNGANGANRTVFGKAAILALAVGVMLIIDAIVLYFPYFLTAQSQAAGILPNLFNPTRFPQFLLMFGFALFGIGALLGLAWQRLPPKGSGWGRWLALAGAVYGFPLLFLALCMLLIVSSETARVGLARLPLPDGATSYWPFVLERWGSQFWTFLWVGALLILVLGALWHSLEPATLRQEPAARSEVFALLLAAIGLLLVFAPEFLYLRDHFGSRMNTVFKFYYQGWLLFGLGSSYAIVTALGQGGWGGSVLRLSTVACSLVSLLLITLGLFYPFAAIYSKTNGFGSPTPTFDATAHLAQAAPAELAAAQWVRANTAPNALVLEAKGRSYWSNFNRMSTLTGRATLLGWDGHESQWRGAAFGRMAEGRDGALETIYRTGAPHEIEETLNRWNIDYVYVGPAEREQYKVNSAVEQRLAKVMDLAFEAGDVRVYRRRSR